MTVRKRPHQVIVRMDDAELSVLRELQARHPSWTQGQVLNAALHAALLSEQMRDHFEEVGAIA